MRKMTKTGIWIALIASLFRTELNAQNVFTTVGSATQGITAGIIPPTIPNNMIAPNNATFQLTNTNPGSQRGAVWENTVLNLTNDFTLEANVYFGNLDFAGADGVAFVLQPNNANIAALPNSNPAVGYGANSKFIGN